MVLNEVLMHIMVQEHHDVLIFRGMTQQSGTLIALEQNSQSSPLPINALSLSSPHLQVTFPLP